MYTKKKKKKKTWRINATYNTQIFLSLFLCLPLNFTGQRKLHVRARTNTHTVLHCLPWGQAPLPFPTTHVQTGRPSGSVRHTDMFWHGGLHSEFIPHCTTPAPPRVVNDDEASFTSWSLMTREDTQPWSPDMLAAGNASGEIDSAGGSPPR